MKNIRLSLLLLVSLLLACSPQRNLVYFSNLSESAKSQIGLYESGLKIQKYDLLNISMHSLSPESDLVFATAAGNIIKDGLMQKQGFKVNSNGTVDLPFIGNVKLEGLSLEEAQLLITQRMANDVKSPVVHLQLLNFKITVIGEVNKPASFTVPDEKINLLEALGMAGDMTVYGKRENVLVIREINGARSMTRLNLNKQEVFQSPYFHLKQNDVIYVEPDKSKEKEYSPNNRALPIVTACISAVAVLITALLR